MLHGAGEGLRAGEGGEAAVQETGAARPQRGEERV